MIARSHAVIGAAAWIAVAPSIGFPPFDVVLVMTSVAGAMLPDIDHPGSWVGRRTRPLSTGIAWMLGHRGITHSALAVIAAVLAMRHFGWRAAPAAAAAVGYLSHLAADMLTPAGLRLAWPLPGIWRMPVCRTGSGTEAVIVACIAAWAVWKVAGNLSGLHWHL